MRQAFRIFIATLALFPLAVLAQDAGSVVPVPEDLLAVLTLRGKPCDRVVSYQRRAEADFDVTCADGHRYRVYVGAGERVVVEERR